MMKQLILFIFSLVLLVPLRAQTVSATTSRDKILIGDTFRLQLEADFSKGQTPAWFTVDTLLHFEVMERSAVDTQVVDEKLQLRQSFKLTSWDSGVWQIPALALGRVKTKPVKIDLAYSPHPFDTSQPYHDIKEIIDVEKPVASKWYWYLIFVLLLLLLFLLFFPAGKKKEKPAFVPAEGAYKAALKKLELLEAKKTEDPKQFYTELVNIYREYLYRRWNIRSFSKTTDDLAIQMDALEMPDDLYRETVQSLRLSDLVKYARYQPQSEETKKALEVIRDSIITIERLPHAV
jgi:hypothetical protein